MEGEKDILKKLYRYCAYQERCKSDVRNKLSELGVPHHEMDHCITHLEEENFLNESRYVHAFVRGKFFLKKWGKHKIIAELRAKGIDKTLIEKVLEEEIDTEQYITVLSTLAAQKLTQLGGKVTVENSQKVHFYLTQKGYAWSDIQEVLKRLKKVDE